MKKVLRNYEKTYTALFLCYSWHHGTLRISVKAPSGNCQRGPIWFDLLVFIGFQQFSADIQQPFGQIDKVVLGIFKAFDFIP